MEPLSDGENFLWFLVGIGLYIMVSVMNLTW
jgi:hypothetical protein